MGSVAAEENGWDGESLVGRGEVSREWRLDAEAGAADMASSTASRAVKRAAQDILYYRGQREDTSTKRRN